jgi:pimeloyl-ACP methyl ester carboxylesterase
MSAPGTTQVEVAGSPLEVLDLGGPRVEAPVVLLHEGLGSIGLWRAFPATLRELTGRRVIAFSRHGHGFSGPPPLPRTPAFFHQEALEILPALLDRLGIDSPALVGHSDGASIGLIYAARHPVEKLVLMAPHTIVEQICVDAITDTREAFTNGDLRARMQRHHADVDAAFWGWCGVWLDPAFRSWTLDAEAAQLQAPTLLIQGRDDPYGTLEQIDRITSTVKGPVERLVLAGGHSPHLEHPDRVAGAVAAFLG